MKYDEKLVDELLADVEQWGKHADYQSRFSYEVFKRLAAIRPKPPKFYVMPEWEEFCKGRETFEDGEVVALMIDETVGVSFGKTIFNAIREATATDKPMVHIPAGKDWDYKDCEAVHKVYDLVMGNGDYAGTRAFINAIKSKLEGRV